MPQNTASSAYSAVSKEGEEAGPAKAAGQQCRAIDHHFSFCHLYFSHWGKVEDLCSIFKYLLMFAVIEH